MPNPHRIDDTIAAIASAPSGSARGIVRVSGAQTRDVLAACFPSYQPQFDSQESVVAAALAGADKLELTLASSRTRLPATVYYWPDSRSYTRQPSAEIHTLGSPPLLAAVLAAVCEGGARPAQPGEFTMRAFLAGRLDLTQAEAVLGVIDARGDEELKHALRQLAGGLAHPLDRLRESLLDLLAHLEAGLDFVEEDIEFVSRDELLRQLALAVDQIRLVQAQLSQRKLDHQLPRVVLVGYPNVGKSTLFNALVTAGSALVSDVPGTTRDYLAADVDLGDGFRFQLVDTAGHEVTEASATVPFDAQRLSRDQLRQSDVEVLCLDCTRPLNAWEHAQLACLATCDSQTSGGQPRNGIVAWTKADLAPEGFSPPECDQLPVVSTSVRSLGGVAPLREAVIRAVRRISWSAASPTAERCASSLRTACKCLETARTVATNGREEELVAAELRLALEELGQVVGAVYTDDILDRVFSRFCIGK